MRYAIIVNPAAGNYRTRKRKWKLLKELRRLDIRFSLTETERPGHAIELAQEAAHSHDVVVAVGGDGTVQEVSQGLIRSGAGAALAVVPSGTGNDFVRMLGISHGFEAALKSLPELRPTGIDYGLVRWAGVGPTYEATFINAVGVGIDAQVANDAPAYKKLPGLTGYLVAALKIIRTWAPPFVNIQAGAEDAPSLVYSGPLLLVTSGNGISSGGGFKLTPEARVNDGLLDVCVVRAAPIHRVLQLLPRALFGAHIGQPEVSVHRTERAAITSNSGLPVHADGEMLTRTATHIEIQIVPQGLRVMVDPTRFEMTSV